MATRVRTATPAPPSFPGPPAFPNSLACLACTAVVSVPVPVTLVSISSWGDA